MHPSPSRQRCQCEREDLAYDTASHHGENGHTEAVNLLSRGESQLNRQVKSMRYTSQHSTAMWIALR